MTSTTWPTALSRVLALGVTSVLATAGSWTVSLLTGLPCGLSGADCSATQAVLVTGWVVQAVLLLVAVVLFLPPAERRLRGARMVATALAVPATAILVLVTTFLVADQVDDTISRPHDRSRYDRGRAPSTRDLTPPGDTRSRSDAAQTQIGEDQAASPSTWTTRA